MPNINQQILDLLLKRDLLITRVSNGLNKKIANEYIKIINNALDSFNKQEISIINMNKIIKEISKRFEFDYDAIAYEQFKELGVAEATYIPQSINALVGVDIVNKVLPEPLIEKVINASFLDKGLLLKDAFAKFDDNLKNVMINEIRNGVLIGATNQQMISNMKPLFNAMTSNNLDSLVKTSVSTVVNDVRMQTYKENESIFSGYQHHSTLDLRTTLICAERDQKKWTLEYKPIDHKLPFKNVPVHFRCRSVILPITKSYRELGLDIDEISEGTRASMNGSVPESTTFDKWFESQSKTNQEKYLGVGRYQLYKEGKITLSQLVNQQGSIIPIKDLNKLSDVVAKPKIPVIDFGYDGKFNKYVADIRDEAKIVIDKLPKPNNILIGKNSYGIDNKTVTIGKNQNSEMFLHEYGHHLDNIIDKKDKNLLSLKTLKEASILDGEKLKIKFPTKELYLLNDVELIEELEKMDINSKIEKENRSRLFNDWFDVIETKTAIKTKPKQSYYNLLSDITDSITGGQFNRDFGASGHGTGYFSIEYKKQTENFANLFALWSDKTHWEETKTLFPNMTKEFEKTMQEVINGKFD
jgi:SPP1 gp7 family putative phage head morphogenesis protein